eukprot:6462177-Prymnesium_polylepis.1
MVEVRAAGARCPTGAAIVGVGEQDVAEVLPQLLRLTERGKGRGGRWWREGAAVHRAGRWRW